MGEEKICIYCMRSDREFDQAHIIPASIGGRIWIENCCKPCNSYFGRTIEGDIKKDLFFAQGIARTNLASLDDALSQLKITDTQSGERLQLEGGRFVAPYRYKGPGSRSGPKSQVRREALREVKKRFPNWLDKYRNDLESGEAVIRLPQEEHIFKEEKKTVTVTLESTASFPTAVLAKIGYESIWFAAPFPNHVVADFWASTFEFNMKENRRSDPRVSGDFKNCTRLLYPRKWHAGVDFTKLTFQPFHYIDFQRSLRGTAWIHVCFFGLMHYMIVAGVMRGEERLNPEIEGKAIILPTCLMDEKLVVQELPERYKQDVHLKNVLADIVADALDQKKLSDGQDGVKRNSE